MSQRGPRREALGTAGTVPGRGRHGHGQQVVRLSGQLARLGGVAAPSLWAGAAADPGGPGLLAYLQGLLRGEPAGLAGRGGFVRGYLQRGDTRPPLRAAPTPARLLPPWSCATRSTCLPAHSGRRANDSTPLSRRVPAFMPRRRPGAFGAISHYRYIGHMRRR